MSSILTNSSAMNALSTLRNVNNQLDNTQNRISTGLKVASAKDNASYFAISESMKSDSGMLKSINESLTLTKNSVATASLGASEFKDLAAQFVERVSFAQGSKDEGLDEVEADLKTLVSQMETVISQSTFNGDDLVNAADAASEADDGTNTGTVTGLEAQADGTLEYTDGTNTFGRDDITNASSPRTVVTGVTRKDGGFSTTSISIDSVDLNKMLGEFKAVANGADDGAGGLKGFAQSVRDAADSQAFLKNSLTLAEANQSEAIDAATKLGQAEKSIETQQEFLTNLSNNYDTGVGAMVDANMEEEAARLQALQVQQQLSTQSLSIANQAPQNILSLFR